VGAFDADGKMLGVVFETATPFDTPAAQIRPLAATTSGDLIATNAPLASISNTLTQPLFSIR